MNFLNKKGRFENSLLILFSLISLGYGLIIGFSDNLTGIRILCDNALGYLLCGLSLLIIILEILFITVFKNQKLKRVLYLTSIIIVLIVAIDFLVLGIVRSFILASGLNKAEAATHGLHVRLAFICLKNYKSILMGVWTTIWLSLAGTVIGLILGLLFITLRTLEVTSRDNEFVALLKKIGCGFVKIYVTIFRGTP